ncbi:MAG: AAA family ATPase [Gammaproteobacteria bacterium]|nr:AAA family ATPase [Gammaproteobacteria bacterium]NND35644.1 AAA family ATPase [Gammaproteobacteria bacterium]
MYEKYFGLDCRPFDLSPDPRFLFMTSQHARAVANIKFALMNRDSFVIITGEIGIGKTTVLNTVLHELGDEYVTANLTHTTLSHIELLQALCSAFGMPNYTRKKVLLLDTLREFFMEQNKQGKHVVIIVDEAQNLSAPALEELRLLSCIDTAERKIVSIVLTGQRGLDDVVDSPGLAQLRQRSRLRQRLDALNEDETFDYIRHRLSVANGDADQIFEPEAIREIHRLSFGIPRLINTLADTALMSCMVEEQEKVTLEAIDAVVQELRWQWFEDRDQEKSLQKEPETAAQQSETAINLTVFRAGQFVEQVRSTSFPIVIGRSNANDLVIVDKQVSRRHALIDCISGIFVIEDLNSKNGILVNRKRRSRALLRSGDTITLGQLDISFQTDEAGSKGPIELHPSEHGETIVVPDNEPEKVDPDEPTGTHEVRL